MTEATEVLGSSAIGAVRRFTARPPCAQPELYDTEGREYMPREVRIKSGPGVTIPVLAIRFVHRMNAEVAR